MDDAGIGRHSRVIVFVCWGEKADGPSPATFPQRARAGAAEKRRIARANREHWIVEGGAVANWDGTGFWPVQSERGNTAAHGA
ncbi:hypothetical protein AXG93_4794s1120 [Marchantia polymorpha subsp. ruderalis]|uniref:Uncharacterized protein n=1 Tax=Marchantia polymorpha subsp. ruderalis TaxID=1480154 RepID=A0A176VF74_MARPO|nr:hypothetical protein AXG93_4794s1120 [Marchantia polymorpha subsp. ruderalis]